MKCIKLSTASFCLWDITPKEKLKICHGLGFESIEIALSTVKMVNAFTANEEALSLLSNFKRITVHAPWCSIKYDYNQRSKDIIQGLQIINQAAAIQGFIFHGNSIKNLDFLIASGLPIWIENSHELEHYNNASEEQSVDYVLNLNKAISKKNNLGQIQATISKFRQITLSGFLNNLYRMPLSYTKQIPLVKHVRHYEVPFVIEGLFQPKDYEGILAERQLIQSFI